MATKKESKKKRVLVVEDEAPLRCALCDELTCEGFEALQAGDGKVGVEIALREHPDLILLDIIMPIMDGLTMLSRLLEDEWGREARVIILTNLSENVSQSIELGSYEYLVKADWKIEDVVTRIRERLKS